MNEECRNFLQYIIEQKRIFVFYRPFKNKTTKQFYLRDDLIGYQIEENIPIGILNKTAKISLSK